MECWSGAELLSQIAEFAMGLFALLAQFLPRLSRRKSPQFAAAPFAPMRLERRRVLDAAAPGLVLEALPDVPPYVQTSEYQASTDESPELAEEVAEINGFPQATIRLRDNEIFEDQSTLAVIEIRDSSPMAHEVTIDWGDGSTPQVINVGPQTRDVLAVHKYLDDNPAGTSADSYTVKAKVTNTLGEEVTVSAAILVKNVAPRIDSLSIDSPISENDTATLTGTYSDPGTLDTHVLEIDWNGDGYFEQSVDVSGGSFSVSRQFLDDNPTGTASDTFNVNVRLRDDDGGEATRSIPLTVNNVAPMLTSVSITSPITENGTATLSGTYTDIGVQDTHTLDIDWDGDGSFDQTVSVSGGSFSVSRQFLDDNPTGTASDTFNVNVRLRDDDGGEALAAVELTVENANPIVMLNSLASIDENGTAVLTGTYQDVGSQDTHELDIDWDDDGVFDQTVAVSGGAFTVTRQFLDDNPTGTPSDTFDVNVRIRDDDGGVGIDSKPLTVRNVNPIVTSLSITSPITENGTATLSGSYSDTGTQDTHTLDIDWDGNGSFDQTISVSGGSFSVSRQFLDDNPSVSSSDTFNVQVRLRDDDGGMATASVPLTVRNVAPILTSLSITSPISENNTATLSGTYTDVGTRDTHRLDIDWNGDGSFDQTVSVSGGSFSVSRQFLDDNPTGTASDTFNVNVRLRDDDGGEATRSIPLTVNNVAPMLTSVSITSPITENGTATLSGTYTDIGVQDTHTLDIDWDGDGSFDQTVSVSGGSFSVSRQFLDDNPTGTQSDTFNVNVRLRDDDGGEALAAVELTVENANPIVMLNSLASIDENGTAVLTGTYQDVGSQDTHELDIDWDDDGVFDQTIAVSGGAFTVTRQFLDDNPSGTPSDTFDVNVRIRDDDGGVGIDSKPLTVRNVNPIVTLVPPATIAEDEIATLDGSISDVGTLDTFTLTVSWGDSASPNNVQTFQLGNTVLTKSVDGIDWDPVTRRFSIDHQYLDDNPSGGPVNVYNILVVVTDDDTGFDRALTRITVRNQDLTLQVASPQTVDEGSVLDLTGGQLGSFFDEGTLDTHTATVDWGDGTGTQAAVVDEANGSGTLSSSHIFADNGTYTVTVAVTDDDGGRVEKSFLVTVLNVDPTLTGVTGPISVDEGKLITLDGLGVGLEDPGFDNPLGATEETLTAVSVDWGDGTAIEPLFIAAETDGDPGVTTKATFQHAAHAYADDGAYTVLVTVRDDDGMAVTREFTIVVHNVDPDLKLTTRYLEINEGETLDLFDLGTFEDPGFNNPMNPNGASAETFHYSIDWSDNTPTQNRPDVASVVDGQQGVTTKGTLVDSHPYTDNDDDNLYTITVTLFDDDGGSDTEQIQVRVLNVNPTLYPLTATDVTAQGFATVTVSFTDPGLEKVTVLIDWGDDKPDAITFTDATSLLTETFLHRYDGPPDPQNPAGDITITVVVRDDDFGIAGIVKDGESDPQSIRISNPGIGGEPFSIDTTPQVPQLTFPVRAEGDVLQNTATTGFGAQQNVVLGGASGETKATTDRYIELCVVDAEGKEGPGYRLRPEVLQDLPGLFRSLPDNHYALYLKNTETNTRRLVIEVYVRNGKLIDPGDDSEGTRDRPPTDEQTVEPIEGAAVSDDPVGTQGPADNQGALYPGTEDPRRWTRWTTLAIGLAASSSSKTWAYRVDEALAKATVEQWRKLQGHNPPKRKKP